MERFTMLLKTVNPSISMDHFPWLCEITRGYIYICICTVYRIDIFPLPRLMTGWYFWLIYNRDILGTSWNHGSRQQPTVMLQPTKRVKLASWHFFLSQFEPPKNWQLVGGLEHFFIFHNIWDNPSHWLSYFSRWLKPPTRQPCEPFDESSQWIPLFGKIILCSSLWHHFSGLTTAWQPSTPSYLQLPSSKVT